MSTTLALLLASRLLAAPADAEPASASEIPAIRGSDDPPPGSAEDQALWRAAREASNDVTIEQYAAARLQQQARREEYLERLADPARRGGLPQDRADDLARRLTERWVANVTFMQSQWPVSKVRGCQYELLNFEGVLFSAPSPQRALQLEDARAAVRDCLDRAGKALGAARRSTAELRETVSEVERAIGPAAPAPAPAASPPAAGSPTSPSPVPASISPAAGRPPATSANR